MLSTYNWLFSCSALYDCHSYFKYHKQITLILFVILIIQTIKQPASIFFQIHQENWWKFVDTKRNFWYDWMAKYTGTFLLLLIFLKCYKSTFSKLWHIPLNCHVGLGGKFRSPPPPPLNKNTKYFSSVYVKMKINMKLDLNLLEPIGNIQWDRLIYKQCDL